MKKFFAAAALFSILASPAWAYGSHGGGHSRGGTKSHVSGSGDGHYSGGSGGSSHKGGHYKNSNTSDHYRDRKGGTAY